MANFELKNGPFLVMQRGGVAKLLKREGMVSTLKWMGGGERGGGRSAKKGKSCARRNFFWQRIIVKNAGFFGVLLHVYFVFLSFSLPSPSWVAWRNIGVILCYFIFHFLRGGGGRKETVTKGQKLPTPKNKKANIPTYFGYATKFGWDRGKEKREIMMVSEFPFWWWEIGILLIPVRLKCPENARKIDPKRANLCFPHTLFGQCLEKIVEKDSEMFSAVLCMSDFTGNTAKKLF